MKLFIVEDSALVRQMFREAFFIIPRVEIVGEAAGADEAIAAIRATTPDVVVVDIKLSQGSGLDVLRVIKTETPSVVVIVVSAFLNPEYRRACRELGADHVFDKATDFVQLVQVIRELAGRICPRPSSGSSSSEI